jgi:hypothetical protein
MKRKGQKPYNIFIDEDGNEAYVSQEDEMQTILFNEKRNIKRKIFLQGYITGTIITALILIVLIKAIYP